MTIISEQELATRTFSAVDGIFLVTGSQADYFTSIVGAHAGQARLIALSTDAHGALLERGAGPILPYYDYLDGAALSQQHFDAIALSENWLDRTGLKIGTAGFDLQELDAFNNFFMFRQIIFFSGICKKILEANPDIKNLFIIWNKNPLPAEYFGDSDIVAATLQFVCEEAGRTAHQIAAETLKREHGETPRPLIDGGLRLMTFFKETIERWGDYRHRVCIALDALKDYNVLARDIFETQDEGAIFIRSIWANRDYQDTPTFYMGSPFSDEQQGALRSTLADHYRQILAAIGTVDALPAFFKNRHMTFQLEYMITQRWRLYIHLIQTCNQFVNRFKVDLFVASDHPSPEGAILAEMYRRAGARVMMTTHSIWPQEFKKWNPGYTAVVRPRGAALQLQSRHHVKDSFVIGLRPPAIPPDIAAKKAQVAGGGKVVLYITNCLELQNLPLTAHNDHFAAIRTLVTVPDHLQDKLTLLIRRKPSRGEHKKIYTDVCGVDPDLFTACESLSFPECVAMADCVVGLNFHTSGYYETLDLGKPLLHVQTACQAWKESAIPDDVLQTITDNARIWPTIEQVLFDENFRAALLAKQRAFIDEDFRPTAGAKGTFRSALDTLLGIGPAAE